VSATSIALEAGELLKERVGAPGRIDQKHVPEDPTRRQDLVTETDYMSERLIIDRIRALNPDAVVLAEESGLSDSSIPLDQIDDLWLVDPLDGTINFSQGLPFFCVSIARYRNGVIDSAAIRAPMFDETFELVDGLATLNGAPIRPAGTQRLGDACIGIGGTAGDLEAATRTIDQCRIWRRLGSAALCLSYVACGRLDAYIQWGRLAPWDWAAGGALVEAVGIPMVDANFDAFNGDIGAWRDVRAAHPALLTELESAGSVPVGG
jgi:myo-inositol-1(or 4)-monophosphatase